MSPNRIMVQSIVIFVQMIFFLSWYAYPSRPYLGLDANPNKYFEKNAIPLT